MCYSGVCVNTYGCVGVVSCIRCLYFCVRVCACARACVRARVRVCVCGGGSVVYFSSVNLHSVTV
jgi:hypothetical protein